MNGIYIALRRTAAVGAPWWQRALCALVRWRLVSQWCHAGVVCDGVLHHVTVTDGLTSTDDWTPNRWELFPLPDSYHRAALDEALRTHEGVKYDWFSLLGFVLPGRWWSDGKRLYCFELPALVLGISTRQRVTPERILTAITKEKNA